MRPYRRVARSSGAPRRATSGARRTRRGVDVAIAGAVLLVAFTAAPAGAQRAIPAGVERRAHATASPDTVGAVEPARAAYAAVAARAREDAAGPGEAPWWAPIASAVAPGTGQVALGQDRWVAFVAVEGAAWLRYAGDRQEARREQRAYQRLANQVARALYSDGSPAAGGFEYYETMEKWVESGVYDAQPGGVLEPESDATTFNGAMWLLARQTYWADPSEPPPLDSQAYRDAIAFYDRRAIRAEYRWSWRNAQLQQDLYRRAILRSNAAYRRAAQDLAAVLANHVLSTVDAYVTVRLRRRAGAAGEEHRLEASLPWPGRRGPVHR